MKTTLSVVFVMALFIQHVCGVESVTGIWIGQYKYPDNSNPPVDFTMILRSDPQSGAFTGRLQEPNTFGNPKSVTLEADIFGLIEDGKAVHILKKYDGKGDKDHSVWYIGTLSDDGITISGKWYIADGWSATFEMKRKDTK